MKRRFRITFGGKTYEVEVEELGVESGMESIPGAPVRSSPSSSSISAAGSESGDVVAPAPGKVLRVSVQPGDSVRSGDELLVLESMKIETRIEAPVSGMVRDVRVKPGDTVKTGEIMVIIQS